MKQRIKLTESTLHRIVKESVKRILKEWGKGDGGWSYETLHPEETEEKEYERKKREEDKEAEAYRHMCNAHYACH